MATDVSRRPAAAGPSPERSSHKGRKPFSAFMKRLAGIKPSSNIASSSRIVAGQRSASCSAPPPSSFRSFDQPPMTSGSGDSRLSFAPNSRSERDASIYTNGSTDSGSLRHSSSSGKSHLNRPALSSATVTTSGFSSRTASVRSLTTTLTTIQSTAPGSLLNANYNPHASHHHNPYAPPVLFQHQFPSSPNANLHSAPSTPMIQSVPTNNLQPVNYSSATANNLWTDNASIITLASSSKHRRRHSLDTDASVRALAPSSLWGGSRESLPLSVLSGNLDVGGGGRSIAGERGSLYGSASLMRAESGSVRDFATGSIMGEISGANAMNANNSSPLVSPTSMNRESLQIGRFSRRSSGLGGDIVDRDDEPEERRRSLSIKSASLKGIDDGDMHEVSSNVGVWNGIVGKEEGGKKVESHEMGKLAKKSAPAGR